jgi:hypothetical protein
MGVLGSLQADAKWKTYVNSMASAGDQDKSFIGAHQPTAALMSAAYQSYANRINNLNPVQEVPLVW